MDLSPPVSSPDVVFLRNALIYFDMEERVRILESMGKVMKKGSVLFLGASEVIPAEVDCFERLQGGHYSALYVRK